MKQMAKISFLLLLVIALAQANALVTPSLNSLNSLDKINYSHNDAEQDFHIDKNGNVSIYQAKVFQVAGTSFYVRYYLGLSFIRLVVKTDINAKIYRRYGDEIPIEEVVAGDTINIFGKVESGSDSLSVIAKALVDFSNQKEVSAFTGTITGQGSTTESFLLTTRNKNVITLNIGTTTQIRKGNRIIGPELVRTGDSVIDTSGTYDHTANAFDARVVVLYIDKNIFAPRNFQGTLKSITTGNPTTLTVSTEGKDYSVFLSNSTAILNTARNTVSLKRYLEGDIIRIYGAIREVEEPIIDAEIVRNISLQ